MPPVAVGHGTPPAESLKRYDSGVGLEGDDLATASEPAGPVESTGAASELETPPQHRYLTNLFDDE
jgi:hypothetical protein